MNMSKYIFYPANRSPALLSASEALKKRGYGVVDRPCESVTHLLLPIPSFEADGSIKGGGSLNGILDQLPRQVTIVGGYLQSLAGYKTIDLLKDAAYLADNAYITAHCAVRLAMTHLPVTIRGCKVLIIGWGRIGKCLTRLLRALEADLTVAARKESDRAMAHALGYRAIDPADLSRELDRFRLILNTVPAPILDEEAIGECRENCILMDLASTKGILHPKVLWARGLPGKDAPESAGELIAKTTIRLLDRKE